MSWKASAWAKEARVGGPAVKALLLALADYANEHHECFPGQERLAWETEQSVSTVRRQLKHLEAIEAIQRVRRTNPDGSRSSDLYRLAVGTTIEYVAPDREAAEVVDNSVDEGVENPTGQIDRLDNSDNLPVTDSVGPTGHGQLNSYRSQLWTGNKPGLPRELPAAAAPQPRAATSGGFAAAAAAEFVLKALSGEEPQPSRDEAETMVARIIAEKRGKVPNPRGLVQTMSVDELRNRLDDVRVVTSQPDAVDIVDSVAQAVRDGQVLEFCDHGGLAGTNPITGVPRCVQCARQIPRQGAAA